MLNESLLPVDSYLPHNSAICFKQRVHAQKKGQDDNKDGLFLFTS